MAIRTRAWAKLNLMLRVLHRREDGYHEIESIFVPVKQLFDLIEIRFSEEPGVKIVSNISELEDPQVNLVALAARLFCQELGVQLRLAIRLTKRIPIGAGLGGGSSDAAAVLRGLNELYGNALGEDRLFELAKSLGSDVPFFLQTKPAIVRGRGDRVVPLERLRCLDGKWVLIIYPRFQVLSKWAYQSLGLKPGATLRPENVKPLEEIIACLDCPSDSVDWNLLENDLEIPVFRKYPILPLYREYLIQEAGALCARMSGSGSAVFGLFDSPDKATRAASAVKGHFGRVWCQTFALG